MENYPMDSTEYTNIVCSETVADGDNVARIVSSNNVASGESVVALNMDNPTNVSSLLRANRTNVFNESDADYEKIVANNQREKNFDINVAEIHDDSGKDEKLITLKNVDDRSHDIVETCADNDIILFSEVVNHLSPQHIELPGTVSGVEPDIPQETTAVLLTLQTDEELPIDEKVNLDSELLQEDVLAEPLEDTSKLLGESKSNIIIGPNVKIDVIPIDVKDLANSDEEDAIPLETRRSVTRRSVLNANTNYKESPSNNNDSIRTRSKKYNKVPVLETSKKLEKNKIVKDDVKKDEANKSIKNDDQNVAEEEDAAEEKCRICLSDESLTNIFSLIDESPISDKIMQICTTVKIMEKDYLPQFICFTCLQSLQVALNFKTLCETTDKDLRSKLKRSKNKIRRPTEFVLIDCNDLSDESEEEEVKLKDDDEFHLSNESANSEPESDSDSSFAGITKRRGRRSGSGRRGRRKSSVTQSKKRGRKPGSLNVKRTRRSKDSILDNSKDSKDFSMEDGDPSSDEAFAPPKKRRSKQRTDDGDSTPENKKKDHQCIYCNLTFSTLNLLREHKKEHAGEKPFTCQICSKRFKLLGSFNTHLRKHKEEDDLMCSNCDKHFANKTEHRKHMVDIHGEPAASFVCEKCKRAFTTKPRLDRHKENKCPGYEITPGKKPKPEVDSVTLGRDLFKCVAPMTTTYWSDSFSE